MKSLEELTTLTNITDLLPRVILEEVEEAARARRFGRNLVQINEDLVRTKGRSIVIGRRATLTASSVAEGATPTQSDLSYTSNTITPSKIGVTVKITQEAIDGANLDLIRDHITEAGIALADKEDQDILSTLLGKTAFSEALVFTGGSTIGTFSFGGTDPVLSITSIKNPNGSDTLSAWTCDYFEGKIGSPSTFSSNTFWVTGYKSSRSNFRDAITAASLSYEDLVGGLGVIRANKWTPDFILVHPNEVNDILKSSAFRDASQYGSPDVLLKGEIGMISGVKVLVSTNMTEGVVLYIASKRAAWLALKRPVDLKRWDNPATDSVELYFYMEYGVAVTDETAVAISVNHMKSTVLARNL